MLLYKLIFIYLYCMTLFISCSSNNAPSEDTNNNQPNIGDNSGTNLTYKLDINFNHYYDRDIKPSEAKNAVSIKIYKTKSDISNKNIFEEYTGEDFLPTANSSNFFINVPKNYVIEMSLKPTNQKNFTYVNGIDSSLSAITRKYTMTANRDRTLNIYMSDKKLEILFFYFEVSNDDSNNDAFIDVNVSKGEEQLETHNIKAGNKLVLKMMNVDFDQHTLKVAATTLSGNHLFNYWKIGTDKSLHNVLTVTRSMAKAIITPVFYYDYSYISIETAADLIKLSDTIKNNTDTEARKKEYRLQRDIDLGGISFTPIGNSTYPFEGIFNGRNHTIKNAKIVNTGSLSGLIGETGESSKIINLTLDSTVTVENSSATYTGGIVGVSKGIISNCVNKASISGREFVGGIASHMIGANAIVINSQNEGKVSGKYAGGIVGKLEAGSIISNSYNTGIISAIEQLGGIAAISINSSIFTSHNEGKVSGKYAGGIVGKLEAGSIISNSYNTGIISAIEQLGGIAAISINSSIFTSHNKANLSGKDIGGIVGKLEAGSIISNSYNTGELSATSKTGGISAIAVNSSIFTSHNKANLSGKDIGGIVCKIEAGSIISNSYNTGKLSATSQTGGISAMAINSSIFTSHNTGKILGHEVGGITGRIDEDSIISNSYNTGELSATSQTGGISALAINSSIFTSHNIGKILGNTGYNSTGGIAGQLIGHAVISNSYNTGNITGHTVGGIGGVLGGCSHILYSYNTGNILANHMAGGITARHIFYDDYSSVSISNSYNSGDVFAPFYSGGITGEIIDSITHNTYNTGNISGKPAGGIVGQRLGTQAYIINAYSTKVPANSSMRGGIFGDNKVTQQENVFFINNDAPLLSDHGFIQGADSTADNTVAGNGGWDGVFKKLNTKSPGTWKQAPDGRPLLIGVGEGK